MPTGRREQQAFIDKMCKNKDIHFSRQQIEKLMYKFDEVSGCQGMKDKSHVKIERPLFRDILFNYFGMTDDVLMDRVFRTFDRDLDNLISREEWVTGLASMLSHSVNCDAKNKCDAKHKFVFFAYDLNGDGYISREEMFQLLKNCLSKQQTDEDKEENIKELVELVLKKADHDHDNRISYSDYIKTVENDPLLIEFLGNCLPDSQKISAFMKEIDGIKMRH